MHGNNTLISLNSKQLTMTSREIAELVESRHDNVKRTIETLAVKGVVSFTQSEEKHTKGRPVIEYLVNKRDSYVVVAQLSPEFTGRLVDRWQELEEQVLIPAVNAIPHIDIQLKLANAAKEMLNLGDISTIRMIDSIGSTHGVDTSFLPSYVDEPLTRSLSELLKLNGSSLSAAKANRILLELGYLQRLTRPSQGKEIKEFWNITSKGLRYGKNEISIKNDKETQPRWFESAFHELLEEIERKLNNFV